MTEETSPAPSEGTSGAAAGDATTPGSGGAGRGQWGSRAGFILAAAGSAVGLGNIWKFPYITGENGGGLFVLIYLACIALVGLPIMVAEIMIGRAARKQPVVAFQVLQGGRTAWSGIGWIGMIAGFVILSFYIVVAGWSMHYTLMSVANVTQPIAAEADKASRIYRAQESMDAMRAAVARDRAKREAHHDVQDVRSQAVGSTWQAFDTYQAALGDTSETVSEEDAVARLFEDAAFKAKVVEAQALQEEIDAIEAKALEEAIAHYGELPDPQVRDEAQALKRRGVIAEKVGAAFESLLTGGWTASFWALLFMSITIVVVAGGVSAGIERACRILMPLLIGLMTVMVIYGVFQPGFGQAFAFVFKPDPSRLKASGVLEALGHAFFTLSLGMGAMMTYGSYQEEKEDLLKQSLWISGLDTLVALLACLMMFPIIFTYGQEPGAGPGLVFMSMPLAFAEIGAGGLLLSIVFFSLLTLAALTSAISLLEVVASFFIDQVGWSRRKAATLLGAAVFLFGLPSAFAFDPDFAMGAWKASFGSTFFDVMDYLASNWLLPIGGLLIAVYAGWFLPERFRDAELEGLAPMLVKGWLFLIRFVAPILVFLVLLQKVGILELT